MNLLANEWSSLVILRNEVTNGSVYNHVDVFRFFTDAQDDKPKS